MKARHLEVFMAIARHRSIRAAARALSISQPAVTKTVRELEQEMGAALLERSSRGVTLTDLGNAFLPKALFWLKSVERAMDEIESLKNGSMGSVAIAVSTSVALSYLPKAFIRLRRELPYAKLTLSETTFSNTLDLIRTGVFDFAITHVDPILIDPEFECQELFPVRLVLGMREGHPLVGVRSLDDLNNSEWILPMDTDRDFARLEPFFYRNGRMLPNRFVKAQSLTIALSLVGSTDLIGLFVETLVESNFERHGIIQVRIEQTLPELKVCIVKKANTKLTATAARFLDVFQAVISERSL